MTGDDKGNPFCDEQMVKTISGLCISVEAVSR
jgi:hypothetical protein